MESDQKIWVLGSAGTKADKHIEWSYAWPYFGDPDVLIINLPALSDAILKLLEGKKLQDSESMIYDKFIHGGTIIIITSKRFEEAIKGFGYFSNYYLSPVDLETVSVTEGHEVIFDEDKHPFAEYLKHVKKFNFYLKDYNFSKLKARSEHLFSSNLPIYNSDYAISDKAGHDLGYCFGSDTGQTIFLPPVSEISSIESINILIEKIKGPQKIVKEDIPDWVSRVSVFGLNKKNSEIDELKSDVAKLKEKIVSAESEKKKLLDYTRLLFAYGKLLETSVFGAFKLLGFDEIKQIRDVELEDGIFEFKNKKDFQYGVIEVKGSENRTSLANLTQCNKWAEDYLLENKTAKGIFIPNQHRLKEYPTSKTDKLHFEPNEFEYASKRQICIIPSCVLFEAVNKKLAGKGKTREGIEELIIKTDGLLDEL